jgi:hypothetical protein
VSQVENLVAIELAYINTKHPDFHKNAALASSLLKKEEERSPGHMRSPHSGTKYAPHMIEGIDRGDATIGAEVGACLC